MLLSGVMINWDGHVSESRVRSISCKVRLVEPSNPETVLVDVNANLSRSCSCANVSLNTLWVAPESIRSTILGGSNAGVALAALAGTME